MPEAWMPTIKQHNSQSIPQRTSEETASNKNNEDRNAPITNNQGATYTDNSQKAPSPDEDQQYNGN